MSSISNATKLLGLSRNASLSELKTVYRQFMKENHPDKFQTESDIALAEERSTAFIEAYKFLVSISPETAEKNKEDYQKTITEAQILGFEYKKQTLTLDFTDGISYEYFDVPRDIYNKLINADSRTRFARRRICGDFLYRKVSQVPVS